MFKKMITSSLHWILNHKSTRKLIEDFIVQFLENPETRKQFEKILQKCLLYYAKKTYGGKI